jgi:hypothetical protein
MAKEIPRYTKPNKLSDVIVLVSALASIQGGAFVNEEGLFRAIRSKPKTTDKWFDIADEFPEFFRRNGKQNYIALLVRSYFEIDQTKGSESRPALTVGETQNLINTVISLHDKELARFQKNAFKIPIRVAWISGCILFLASLINASVAIHSRNNPKIDAIKTTLDSVVSFLRNGSKYTASTSPKADTVQQALPKLNIKH